MNTRILKVQHVLIMIKTTPSHRMVVHATKRMMDLCESEARLAGLQDRQSYRETLAQYLPPEENTVHLLKTVLKKWQHKFCR